MSSTPVDEEREASLETLAVPERYDAVSPMRLMPRDIPQRLVIGELDSWAPAGRAYFDAPVQSPRRHAALRAFDELAEEIDTEHANSYDFLYLPCDLKVNILRYRTNAMWDMDSSTLLTLSNCRASI